MNKKQAIAAGVGVLAGVGVMLAPWPGSSTREVAREVTPTGMNVTLENTIPKGLVYGLTAVVLTTTAVVYGLRTARTP